MNDSELVIHTRAASGLTVRLAAVGDVATSGRVAEHFVENGPGARWGIFDHFGGADLVFGNLEGVVTQATDRPFAVKAGSITELHRAGFNILNLANNHAVDESVAGLRGTLGVVESVGVTALGIAPPKGAPLAAARTDLNGVRIGWLAAAKTLLPKPEAEPWIVELDEAVLTDAVQRARAEVDVLVLSLHLGFMLIEYPAPEDRAMALRLADAGADLILMHHPHVLQGVEVTPGGQVICYSLGNFLFDWREGEIQVPIVEDLQRQGGIFDFELDREGVASATFRPTVLDDRCRVEDSPPDLANEICNRLQRLSRELQTDYSAEFDRQRAERNTSLGFKTLLNLLAKGRMLEFSRQLRRFRGRHLGMVGRWLMGTSSRRGAS
jgi:poly-gamma-glutamate synthesis protein (capsule biosynthesis protein)